MHLSGALLRWNLASIEQLLTPNSALSAILTGGVLFFLQPLDQAGCIPSSSAHLLYIGVKLIDQRGDRHLGAVPVGFA